MHYTYVYICIYTHSYMAKSRKAITHTAVIMIFSLKKTPMMPGVAREREQQTARESERARERESEREREREKERERERERERDSIKTVRRLQGMRKYTHR